MVAEQAQQIAQTILQQLGGPMFTTMVGAKNLTFDKDGTLSMKIGRNAKGVTHVKIALTPLDEYQMTFYKIRNTDIKVLAELDHVYCDQLREIFEKETGLYTQL